MYNLLFLLRVVVGVIVIILDDCLTVFVTAVDEAAIVLLNLVFEINWLVLEEVITVDRFLKKFLFLTI